MRLWCSYCTCHALLLLSACTPMMQHNVPSHGDRALTWQQFSGEYRALSYQAFQIATTRLNAATQSSSDPRPKAIIVDIDETVLSNSRYHQMLARRHLTHQEARWHRYVQQVNATPMPGAIAFFNRAQKLGVAVFYITNRSEHDRQATITNLKKLGFPNSDRTHVLTRTDHDLDKHQRRADVMNQYHVILFMGDNLEDFNDGFINQSAAKRRQLVDLWSKRWGQQYILLPNPLYGHWGQPISE